jgi:hypothetical protein
MVLWFKGMGASRRKRISMTAFDKQLAEGWGAAATHSDYSKDERIRYRVGDAIYTGTIIWIAAPSDSRVAWHDPLPLRYIVERDDWTGFPDVVYSADILTSEPEEQTLVKCPYCGGHHFKGMVEFCPRNPHKP